MGKPCTYCIDATKFNKPSECTTLTSDHVVYAGPDLPCSNILTQDTLTVVIQKINTILCLGSTIPPFQKVLEAGNTATDIGAKFISSTDPLLFTEILNNSVTTGAFIKIDGLPTEYLMADGSVSTISDIITQTITNGDIIHAPSGDAVFDALALKLNRTGPDTFNGQLTIDSGTVNDSGLILKNIPATKTNVYTITNPNTFLSGIIKDSTGNVYINSLSNGLITKVTPAGVITTFTDLGSTCNSLCINSNDLIYAILSNGNVYSLTLAGVSTLIGTIAINVKDTALDTAGNMYAIYSTVNTVTKITPAGVVTTYGTIQASDPRWIVVDASSNVYVTSGVGAGFLTKITPAGVSTPHGTYSNSVGGIDIASNGDIFITNFAVGGDEIHKVTLAGVKTYIGKVAGRTVELVIDPTTGDLLTQNFNTLNISRVTQAGVSTIEGTTPTLAPTGSGGITATGNGNIYTISYSGGSLQILSKTTELKPLAIDSFGKVVKTQFLEDVQYALPSDVSNILTQIITNGDITHAPSGDAVYDALQLKANDDNVIHKTLDETKTGQLIVQPIDTSISALKGVSVDGVGVFGESESSPGVFGASQNLFGVQGQSYSLGGIGVYGTNQTGGGVAGISDSGTGVQGLSASGPALVGKSTTGISLILNNASPSNINSIASFRLDDVEKAFITSAGDYVANSFIKIGGTSAQFLKADGSIDSNSYATTLHASTHESGGLDPIFGENLSVIVVPPTLNYSPLVNTLKGHLQGIDAALGNVVQTTAGITNRVFYTGDVINIVGTNYYLSNPTGKGSVAGASPTPLVNDDNQKKYFAQDIISTPFTEVTPAPAGVYSGNLSVRINNDNAQQRYTIEVYKTSLTGTPLSSGVSGAPIGDLGVTVVAILDSGLLNLVGGDLMSINLSGYLTQEITFNVNERIRYHVSAAKVGTTGGTITMEVFYGNNYNSYYDVPVISDTNSILNRSTVPGATATNALDYLNSVGQNLITGLTTNYLPKWNGTKFVNAQVFDNGTNIGIGTTSPLAKLHIDNGTIFLTCDNADAGFGRLRFKNTLGAKIWSFMTGRPGFTNDGFGLRNETNITNPIWITNDDFVGIRTTSPTAPFHVTGTVESDGPALGPDLATSGTGTNWTGTSFSGAGYTHTPGSTDPLTTTIVPLANRTYEILVTITNLTTGSFTMSLGGITSNSIGSNGTARRTPYTNSAAPFLITPTSDFDGTITLTIKLYSNNNITPIATFNSTGNNVKIEIRGTSSNSTYESLFIGKNTGAKFLGLNDNGANLSATAFGHNALVSLVSGDGNTAFGNRAGFSVINGQYNNFFGTNAGSSLTTGNSNDLFGVNSGTALTTGVNNTFYGFGSGAALTNSGYNVAFGNSALNKSTTGNNNIAIGYLAGALLNNKSSFLTSVSNSVYIGYRASALAVGADNEIVIGYNAIGAGTNTTTIGNSSTTKTILYGNVEATVSFIKQGAPATNILLAGGTDIPQSTFLTSSNITGTQNYLPKYGVSGLTQSLLFDNGTRIGLGTTSPGAKLSFGNFVSTSTPGDPQTIALYETGNVKYGFTVNNSTGGMDFSANHGPGTELGFRWYCGSDNTAPTLRMKLFANGNLGINQPTPTEKLDVVGNIKASGNITTIPATASNHAVVKSQLDNLTVGMTTDYIPKWNGTRFVNSLMTDNGVTTNIGEANKFTIITGGQTIAGLSDSALKATLSLRTANPVKSINFGYFNESFGVIQGYTDPPGFPWSLLINPFGGQVGIGVTDPTENLDVGGSIRASTILIAGKETISQSGLNQTISGRFFNTYSTTNGTQYNLLGIYGTTAGNNDVFTHTTGELSKNFYLGLVSNLAFFNNGVAGSTRFSIINKGVERFSIDSFSGNVGIGVTTPQGALSIFTGTSGTTVTPGSPNIPFGSIAIGNLGGTTASPAFVGRSNDSTGLTFSAGTNDTNSVDMAFFVSENNNSDFSILTSIAYRFSRFGTHLLSILRNGNVGIGITAPTEKLDVVGNIKASGTITPSDIRLKSNIIPIENALVSIMKLKPVSYDKAWEIDGEVKNHEFGFIAHEVKEIFKGEEIVKTAENEDEILNMNYISMIAVLTKAIQEQQKQIEYLTLIVESKT